MAPPAALTDARKVTLRGTFKAMPKGVGRAVAWKRR